MISRADRRFRCGDFVLYEFPLESLWRWGVGTVVAEPHPRLVNLRLWSVKERELSQAEQRRSNEILEVLRQKTELAESQRLAAEELARAVEERTRQAAAEQQQAESSLRAAQTSLEEAKAMVGKINAEALREMRSYTQPPLMVVNVLEAVQTILQGKRILSEWEIIRSLVRKDDFIATVRDFDPATITDEIAADVEARFIRDEHFTYENAQRASRAAGPLLLWVHAQLKCSRAWRDLQVVKGHMEGISKELKGLKDQLALAKTKADLLEDDVARLRTQHDDLLLGGPGEVPVASRDAPPMSEWYIDTRFVKSQTVLRSSILFCLRRMPSPQDNLQLTGNELNKVHASFLEDDDDDDDDLLPDLPVPLQDTKQLEELKVKAASLEDELAETAANAALQKRELAEAEATVAEMKKAAENAATNIRFLEARIVNADDTKDKRIKQLEDEAENAKKKSQQDDDEIAKLRAQLRAALDDLAAVNKAGKDAQEQNAKRLEDLERRAKEADSQARQTAQALAERDAAQAALTATVGGLQAESAKAAAQSTQLSRVNEDLESAKSRLEQELQQARNIVSEMAQKIAGIPVSADATTQVILSTAEVSVGIRCELADAVVTAIAETAEKQQQESPEHGEQEVQVTPAPVETQVRGGQTDPPEVADEATMHRMEGVDKITMHEIVYADEQTMSTAPPCADAQAQAGPPINRHEESQTAEEPKVEKFAQTEVVETPVEVDDLLGTPLEVTKEVSADAVDPPAEPEKVATPPPADEPEPEPEPLPEPEPEGEDEWTFELNQVPRPTYLIASFGVTKLGSGIMGRKLRRIWMIDYFQQKIHNCEMNGKVSKSFPTTALVQLERDPIDPCKLHLLFYGAEHKHELLFDTPYVRERFYELAQATRPAVTVCAPDLVASTSQTGGKVTIDAQGRQSMVIAANDLQGKTTKKKLSGICCINASPEPVETLKVWVGTHNLGEKPPPLKSADLEKWIPKTGYDLYVVTVHEATYQRRPDEWYKLIARHLGKGYASIASIEIANTMLTIFSAKRHIHKLANVQGSKVRLSEQGHGGAGISFIYLETTFCFVTVYLPRAAINELRCANLEHICKSLELGNKLTDFVNQFDHAFIFGEFGYPLAADVRDNVAELVNAKDFDQLMQHDELTRFRAKTPLSCFSEPKVAFPPTSYTEEGPCYFSRVFHYSPGWSRLDSTVQSDVVSECPVVCTRYDSVPSIVTSKYAPVVATFAVQCTRVSLSCFSEQVEPVPRFVFDEMTLVPLSDAVINHPVVSVRAPFGVSLATTEGAYAPKMVGDAEKNVIVWNCAKLIPIESTTQVQAYLERRTLVMSVNDAAINGASESRCGTAVIPLRGRVIGQQDLPQRFVTAVLMNGRPTAKMVGTFHW